MNIEEILRRQRAFFQSGAMPDVKWRVRMLKKMRSAVNKYEAEIADTLKADQGKSDFEGFMCETGMSSYHGKTSLGAFSHRKSIVDQ